MTGRDLITYILEHHLEDSEVVKNGVPIGLLSIEELAAKKRSWTRNSQSMDNSRDY